MTRPVRDHIAARLTTIEATIDGRSDARAALDLAITEKAWMAQVVAAARSLGWEVFHPLNSRGSEPGWPDLVCIRKAPRICQPSTLIVAELKTERGRLTPAQRHWLDLFESCDVRTYVWRPSDWEQVEYVLREG